MFDKNLKQIKARNINGTLKLTHMEMQYEILENKDGFKIGQRVNFKLKYGKILQLRNDHPNYVEGENTINYDENLVIHVIKE